MKTIKENLLDLISVRSDSGTALEIDAAKRIYELIQEDPYFREHPDHCGLYDGGDVYRRPVVWALKKGPAAKTVVLSGHYDVVSTANYGALEEYALTPDKLKEEMLKSGKFSGEVLEDLQNENWMFGRGSCDMKAGLAINLQMLYEFEPTEKSLLFTALSDEENLSAGARQAVVLYKELKERFGLDYFYGIVSEPFNMKQTGKDDPAFFLDGTGGKILPIAVVKGRLAHSAYSMNGINSAAILAEMIRNVDMSTEFLTPDMGVCNQPPTTQLFGDLKNGYDVSTPEYSAAGFNFIYYASIQPTEIVDRLCGVARRACAEVVGRFNAVYQKMVDNGQLDPIFWVDNQPQVMTLAELRELLKKTGGFEEKDRELLKKVKEEIDAGLTMQKAGINYVKSLMDLAGFEQPTVVIGVVPPFYPTVNNTRMTRDLSGFNQEIIEELKKKGINMKVRSYSQGITDISYLSCADPDKAMEVMNNMAIPADVYNTDFRALAEVNIPAQLIGPAGRNLHQNTERVYLPDVEYMIPEIFRTILRLA